MKNIIKKIRYWINFPFEWWFEHSTHWASMLVGNPLDDFKKNVRSATTEFIDSVHEDRDKLKHDIDQSMTEFKTEFAEAKRNLAEAVDELKSVVSRRK